jgi:hypothetical protein
MSHNLKGKILIMILLFGSLSSTWTSNLMHTSILNCAL